MFKFIGKALAGVVLTKDAQAAVGKAVQSRGQPVPAKGKAAAAPAAGSARAKQVAGMQARMRGAMTPERTALIQNAMKVRAAKQQVIGELSDEARAHLVGITLIGLMKADEKTPKSS